MGSSSSKFRKYMQHGDEYAAMHVYHNSPELQKSLDPNLSYGENHGHNTALHYACHHGMKHLLRKFLLDHVGNPNKRNGRNETALHLACLIPLSKTSSGPSAAEKRQACVALLMVWKGESLPNGDVETIDLRAQDEAENTALHNAAMSGLQPCVEFLVNAGAPLFLENKDRLTPCDVAMKAGHHDIALFLESRMVFADAPASSESDLLPMSPARSVQIDPMSPSYSLADGKKDAFQEGEEDEVYTGLRSQDLQEAKDQLVIETADMLHIPLFTAEALLREHEWSRELLLEKWMEDAVQVCTLAGVQPPVSALNVHSKTPSSGVLQEHLDEPLASPGAIMAHLASPERSASLETDDLNEDQQSCDICLEPISSGESPVVVPCFHTFCRRCWSSYLTVKIAEGDAHHILCPAYGCAILVPIDVIEALVSADMARKYLQYDINAFVATNPCIKWCPMPGCGRAVKLPEAEQQPQQNQPLAPPPPPSSRAVDCGNGHFFCWECLGEAHAPAGCEQWQAWLAKVQEIKPEQLASTGLDTEDAANCFWLVTHCKACPNCRSPIQKNEGCNHMKCSKCKFDFCWVCLESWKKHSSATGGYFRCNRFDATHKADEKQGSLINEALQRSKQLQELNRFLHYYTRYKNHDHSRVLEEPLLHSAKKKMELLASSLAAQASSRSGAASNPSSPRFDSTNDMSAVFCRSDPTSPNLTTNSTAALASTKFIEDGIRELLKARRILCGSYVYGYYLEDNGYNKTIFEFMQNELEGVTEKLSEMVARPYLRTPRSSIVNMTAQVRRKRHEFTRAVSKGLIPPETPPALRRFRRRRFPGLAGMDPPEDEPMSEAIAASLRELDPNNPWIKDSQGRHTNLAAIYDWPDANSDEEDSDVNQALAVSLLGPCGRPGCGRARARNPRTGRVHGFCSLRCSRYDQTSEESTRFAADVTMDLVIALEMSRLQLIEDEMKKQNRGQASSSLPQHLRDSQDLDYPPNDSSEEAQLRLAIHLSLQEAQTPGSSQAVSPANFILSPPTVVEEPAATGSQLSSEGEAADLAVNYFLRSLAKHELSLRNFDCEPQGDSKIHKNLFDSPDSRSPALTVPLVSSACPEADGHFEISDLHENGAALYTSASCEDNEQETVSDGGQRCVVVPRRSQSTGDVRRLSGKKNVVDSSAKFELEPHCHHLGVEEMTRLALNGSAPTRTLLRLESLGTDFGSDDFQYDSTEDEDNSVKKCCLKKYLELSQLEEEEGGTCKRDDSSNCSQDWSPCGDAGATGAAREDSEPQESTRERRQGRKLQRQSQVEDTSRWSPGLRLSLTSTAAAAAAAVLDAAGTPLQPDSDVEPETGIPRSPTLYISGISICRTPEPNALLYDLTADQSPPAAARQSRSSSLTVPQSPHLGRVPVAHARPHPPCRSRSASLITTVPVPAATPKGLGTDQDSNRHSISASALPGFTNTGAGGPLSPFPVASPRQVSRSACEPQREKQVFCFPKSPTEGALSTVLLVEGTPSSDDFHEALFLPKSPRLAGEKRRRRSRKDKERKSADELEFHEDDAAADSIL